MYCTYEYHQVKDMYEYRILGQLNAMSTYPLLNLPVSVTFTTEEFITNAKVQAHTTCVVYT